jgi:O-antigen ligase
MDSGTRVTRSRLRYLPATRLGGNRDRSLWRVRLVWYLLFFDVLGSGSAPLLPIPHRAGQVLTQGALVVATLLALTINPALRVRRSLYLGIYTLLAITSLMSSVRLVSVGTAYRGLRLVDFVGVLWLLTPWWGRRDQVILKAQLRFLGGIVAVVALGLLVSPHSALQNGRLQGAFWPIPPTQVGHYAAELTGLAILLWFAGALRRRTAAAMAVVGLVVLVLTHTRTALVGLVVGLLVACASMFITNRRVRRTTAIVALVLAVVAVPVAPLAVSWLARGETATELADLTGRTNYWSYVLAEQRPLTNEVLGDGLSNGSVNNPNMPSVSGLPIDSSWVLAYQDQGLLGDALIAMIFLALLIAAGTSPPGPRRAVALFLITYCVIASVTEDGAGLASQYAMDLTAAASLLAARPALVLSTKRRLVLARRAIART